MPKRLIYGALAALVTASATLSILLLASHPAMAGKPNPRDASEHAITVEARPIEFDPSQPGRRHFGKLEWLGGIALTSDSPYFGGLSGLIVDTDGRRILAVSDAGLWLSGEIVGGQSGPTGLTNVRTGPLLGKHGKPITRSKDRDAEAITRAGSNGQVYISFERRHRIELTPWRGAGPGTPRRQVALPRSAQRAKRNSGIEGMALLTRGPQAGSLLFFTESLLDEAGNHRGWLVGRSKPAPVTLKRLKEFDITDLAVLPDGDLLVLERRFRFLEGVKMRIRRVEAEAIRPGALLEGEVLLEAGNGLTIDNMEGIAVHNGPEGEPVITLISDDNFNRGLQRTLLLQFALPRQQLGRASQ
jgi:hypothetical protein